VRTADSGTSQRRLALQLDAAARKQAVAQRPARRHRQVGQHGARAAWCAGVDARHGPASASGRPSTCRLATLAPRRPATVVGRDGGFQLEPRQVDDLDDAAVHRHPFARLHQALRHQADSGATSSVSPPALRARPPRLRACSDACAGVVAGARCRARSAR
jgi:hypothetical protein